MARVLVVAGAILAGLGVAAGSFGAHGLKGLLEETGRGDNWETAVRYCMYHSLAVLVVGMAAAHGRMEPGRALMVAAGWCFVAGTLVFSGCLAVLAVSGVRFLGAIVPIGGTLFLVGWALLAVAASRLPS